MITIARDILFKIPKFNFTMGIVQDEGSIKTVLRLYKRVGIRDTKFFRDGESVFSREAQLSLKLKKLSRPKLEAGYR